MDCGVIKLVLTASLEIVKTDPDSADEVYALFSCARKPIAFSEPVRNMGRISGEFATVIM